MRHPHRYRSGFTLIELMIAIVVIAVLLMAVLPSYQHQLRKTRRSLGVAALQEVMMRQEQYFTDHKLYADSFTDLGFPSSPYALNTEGDVVAANAERRIYLISLATRSNSFTLFATPQFGQSQDSRCGTLSLSSTGIREVSGAGEVAECW